MKKVIKKIIEKKVSIKPPKKRKIIKTPKPSIKKVKRVKRKYPGKPKESWIKTMFWEENK